MIINDSMVCGLIPEDEIGMGEFVRLGVQRAAFTDII